jgi:hypothetical protein
MNNHKFTISSMVLQWTIVNHHIPGKHNTNWHALVIITMLLYKIRISNLIYILRHLVWPMEKKRDIFYFYHTTVRWWIVNPIPSCKIHKRKTGVWQEELKIVNWIPEINNRGSNHNTNTYCWSTFFIRLPASLSGANCKTQMHGLLNNLLREISESKA